MATGVSQILSHRNLRQGPVSHREMGSLPMMSPLGLPNPLYMPPGLGGSLPPHSPLPVHAVSRYEAFPPLRRNLLPVASGHWRGF